MKTVEKTTFEGRPAYKVSLVKKDGGEDLEFYDVETGLLSGATRTRETQMGPVSVTQIQTDYKKFGDLLVPTTMKQTAMTSNRSQDHIRGVRQRAAVDLRPAGSD